MYPHIMDWGTILQPPFFVVFCFLYKDNSALKETNFWMMQPISKSVCPNNIRFRVNSVA